MTDPYRRFHIKLCKHTGAVVLWQHRSYVYTGTLEQCERAYRDAQTHNLLAGWWSLISLLVMNWVALMGNLSAIRQVRTLAERPPAADVAGHFPNPAAPVGPPPGWYPDPAGQGQRYWDGAGWTHWTHLPGLQPAGHTNAVR